MDLKNGAITVGEVLDYPGARDILRTYFPQVADNALLLGMARSWTLNRVLRQVGGQVDAGRVRQMRQELENL
ncbi:MAG: hypothetical protein LUE89_12235 [Clostridiales bacterium]|nr:hypothetical protein [Clostridiales bacterium]